MHAIPTENIIEGYRFINELGNGQYGTVYKVEKQNANGSISEFACKIIPMSSLSHQQIRINLEREIQCMREVANENVIKCINQFQTTTQQFIVMELCSTDLEKEIINSPDKRLSEVVAIGYLKQIVNGFKGLHERRIVHRDLKAPNVLITKDGVLKIADLGFSRKIEDGESAATIQGTPLQMAPEILFKQLYDFKVDVWSLGVLYFQMLTGTLPFNPVTKVALKNALIVGYDQSVFDNKFKHLTISEMSKDFIKRCLVTDPIQRMSWQQVYEHALLKPQSKEDEDMMKQNVQFYGNVIQQISFDEESELKAENDTLKQQQAQQTRVIPEVLVQVSNKKEGELQQQQTMIISQIHRRYLFEKDKLSQISKVVSALYGQIQNQQNTLEAGAQQLCLWVLTKYYLFELEELFGSLSNNENSFQFQSPDFIIFLKSEQAKQFRMDLSENIVNLELFVGLLEKEIEHLKTGPAASLTIRSIVQASSPFFNRSLINSPQLKEQLFTTFKEACALLYKIAVKLVNCNLSDSRNSAQELVTIRKMDIAIACSDLDDIVRINSVFDEKYQKDSSFNFQQFNDGKRNMKLSELRAKLISFK